MALSPSRARGHRGFTLIELLVVVALVGLLAASLLASMSSVRARTRDAQRLSDLRQIQTALENHRAGRGFYPVTTNDGGHGWWGQCHSDWGEHGTTGANGYIPGLAPTYMPVLPLDPRRAPNPNNCYVYRSDGTDYMIIAYGTVETRRGAANPAPRPQSPTEASFAFYTPGARTW